MSEICGGGKSRSFFAAKAGSDKASRESYGIMVSTMNTRTRFLNAAFALVIAIVVLWPVAPAQASTNLEPLSEASAYALIAAVNDLRTANGLNALNANTLISISAQSHSEYQASVGYWTHSGSDGSNETSRALAVGYGGGLGVACDEAVAVASSDKDASYIVYTLWGDYTHRNVVLLNAKYVDIGAGVAQGSDGMYYYTVNLCVSEGSVAATSSGSSAVGSQNTAVYSYPAQTQTPMMTATPREDGSTWHTVKLGDTLWSISKSYNKSVEDILALNGRSPTDQDIYAGQELLIYKAPTPTTTPTITNTPRPPTRTPRPTQTLRPTRATATITITPTITATPGKLALALRSIDEIPRGTWGWIILAVSLLGLGWAFLFSPRKVKNSENLSQLEEMNETHEYPLPGNDAVGPSSTEQIPGSDDTQADGVE